MEWLLAIAIAVGALWWWHRSKQNAAVAESALRSLVELDALGEALWEKLEVAISNAPRRREVCRAMLAMDRARLPPEINDLWSRLDEITARINQRAEHYELVARRPAPPLAGRRAGDELMLKIQQTASSRGDRDKHDSSPKPTEVKKRDASERPKAITNSETATVEQRLSALTIEMMITVSMEQLVRNPNVRDGEVGLKIFAALEQYLGASEASKMGLTTRRVIDQSSLIAAVFRLNAAKAVSSAAEENSGRPGSEFISEASKVALLELEQKQWRLSSRVSSAISDVLGVLAQRYQAEHAESGLPPGDWLETFGRNYEARFG